MAKHTTWVSPTTAATCGQAGCPTAIYVFDVGSNPAKPKLEVIADLPDKTGYIGPHTFYAMPGRMLVGTLSNTRDKGGVTGLALFNNKGDLIRKYDIPADKGGDGYGYDIGINPRKNLMLTSSFTGYDNYMRDWTKSLRCRGVEEFGQYYVAVGLKAMKPKKVLGVPGAPLEIRWSLKEGENWAVVATALTSKIWLIREGANGEWEARDVATIGDPAKIPLPVDISISRDGKGLWVNTFMDGKTRYFDLSNPEAPKQTYEKVTGKQVNMVSQSWDGKRVYVTSSLLEKWDKKGADNEQFLRAFNWDGKELKPAFEVDFTKEKLGRPSHEARSSPCIRVLRPETPCESRPHVILRPLLYGGCLGRRGFCAEDEGT